MFFYCKKNTQTLKFECFYGYWPVPVKKVVVFIYSAKLVRLFMGSGVAVLVVTIKRHSFCYFLLIWSNTLPVFQIT